MLAEREALGIQKRFRQWIEDKRNAAGRTPKRYPNIEAAYERMKTENAYLTDEQARHLTVHGISRNEDGTWSWKFDNYLNIWAIFDMPREDLLAIMAGHHLPDAAALRREKLGLKPRERWPHRTFPDRESHRI